MITITPLGEALIPQLVDLWVAAWTQAMPQIDFEARRPWLVAISMRSMLRAM